MDALPFALIIEDNEDQNLVFTKALEHAGFKTESLFDGAVARERLHQIRPEVIVLDLHLPHVNGDKLLSQIRNDPNLTKTRIILATADAAMAEYLYTQTDLVLLKPVSFSQLTNMAARLNRSARQMDMGDNI